MMFIEEEIQTNKKKISQIWGILDSLALANTSL